MFGKRIFKQSVEQPPPPKPIDYNEITAEKENIEYQLLSNTLLTRDQKNAYQLRLSVLQDLIQNDDKMRIQAYDDDFVEWLKGSGKESDHAITPWYRTPLTNLPGVSEYLERGFKEKYELLKKLAVLKLKGVYDLSTAEEYFKFIVRGEDAGIYNFLNKYSVKQQEEKNRRLLGDKLIDKLNNYITPTIKPEWQLIADDLTEYLAYEDTIDADERAVTRNKLGRRSALLSSLSNHINEGAVQVLVKKYEDKTADYKALFLSSTKSIQTAIERKQVLLTNLKNLKRAGVSNTWITSVIDNEITVLESTIAKNEEYAAKYRSKLDELPLEEDVNSEYLDFVLNGKLISNDVLYKQLYENMRTLITLTYKIMHILEVYGMRQIATVDLPDSHRVLEFFIKVSTRLRVLQYSQYEDNDENLLRWEEHLNFKDSNLRKLVEVMKKLSNVLEDDNVLQHIPPSYIEKGLVICMQAVQQLGGKEEYKNYETLTWERELVHVTKRLCDTANPYIPDFPIEVLQHCLQTFVKIIDYLKTKKIIIK